MNPIPQDVFNTQQAADYLACTINALKISRVTGMLWSNPAPKFIKAGERKILYRRAELDNFLDQLKSYSNTAEAKADGAQS